MNSQLVPSALPREASTIKKGIAYLISLVSRTDLRMSSSIGRGGVVEARRSIIGQALQSGTRSEEEEATFGVRAASADSVEEVGALEDIHQVVPPAELRPGK